MKRIILKATRLLSLILICYTFINCSSPDNSDEEEIEIIKEDEGDVDDTIKYTTVNTITDFIATLNQNDVNIKLTPGTYKFGPDDVASGLIPTHEMIVFRGNNSNYDFTGVTFEFDTQLFREYGNEEVVELRLYGNNITAKNLTIIDTGDAYPLFRARNIHFDGLDNTIEGFNISSKGSFPYGYGDVFGKGGTYVIKHHKHSTILIRGERNHLKNCTITQRSYGHGIFVQGGINTVIEGCKLYGEVRKTDDMLAEQGTGSPADNVNFMSVWGYRITPGTMFSLQEDGIRAYNTGEHYITGQTVQTSGLKVIDCTVDKFRSGITIGFANDEKLIQNCEATGTENAYWVGSSGTIIDSRGDAVYGPIYTSQYESDKNCQIDLTIIDKGYEKYGTHQALYLGGTNQNITLKTTETKPQENLNIAVSGTKTGLRFLAGIEHKAASSTLINQTGYSVILGANSTGCNIQSCSTVTDNGTANTVTQIKCN
tara:strand:- start:2149 stop:3600 length:1452 start_codon:yes stop_codon:yes gene_type:complete